MGGVERYKALDVIHGPRAKIFDDGRLMIRDLIGRQLFPWVRDEEVSDLAWAIADQAMVRFLADPRAALLRAAGDSAGILWNEVALFHAVREITRLLDNAQKGDETARARLIAAAAERGTMAALKDLTWKANRVAPTSERIRQNEGLVTPNLSQLRFSVGRAQEAIARAEGCKASVDPEEAF